MWHHAQGLNSKCDLIIFHDPIPRSCYACSSAWMQETALGNQLQMTLNRDPWRQLRLLQSCLRWRPDQFLSLLCSLSFFSFHIRRKLHYPGLVITRLEPFLCQSFNSTFFVQRFFFSPRSRKKVTKKKRKKNWSPMSFLCRWFRFFCWEDVFFGPNLCLDLFSTKKWRLFCGCVFSGASANLGSNHPLMWLTSFESNLLKVEILPRKTFKLEFFFLTEKSQI